MFLGINALTELPNGIQELFFATAVQVGRAIIVFDVGGGWSREIRGDDRSRVKETSKYQKDRRAGIGNLNGASEFQPGAFGSKLYGTKQLSKARWI
ncbi:hypothetical protein SADFL11_00001740 [Roseibium alexandrii DFL-11]|uniref:Uncharacterized protein n=1 Tax=Roseibium alexandrii (strain DSM 17067 / NCIMB 14079 / DFL-11) TaxID=244592 RepID=A0A5E8UXY1_ROSAD|nr:hypothetical protein SADFL11_00001740 [Roseibium alexandrii DFL-11]